MAVLVVVASCFNVGCSSSVEKDFKRACKSTVGEKDICNCVYEEMKTHYGEQQFEEMAKGEKTLSDDYPQVVEQVIYACAAKLSR
ncbi:hypothetical protein CAP51_02685 [Acinetobacter populi]|uniref:Uncharacterized protein n=2 Tax=Acinetobacter populi TaxID=1582270 RepID=A0A1Z9Z252_9GAMM|nr:hypothetical protein CAP51_02685 [Acinetobacter populi]